MRQRRRERNLTAFAAFFRSWSLFQEDYSRFFRRSWSLFQEEDSRIFKRIIVAFFGSHSQSLGGHIQRYVRKRLTADCHGGCFLQVFASASAPIKSGRNLSPGKTCHVVQAGYFSYYVRRGGDYSGNGYQWKDHDSCNAVPRNGRSWKSTSL